MTYSERYLAVRVASRSPCSLVQRSGRSARVLRFTVNAYARPRVVPTRWESLVVYFFLSYILYLSYILMYKKRRTAKRESERLIPWA